jgi:hypothetical protein
MKSGMLAAEAAFQALVNKPESQKNVCSDRNGISCLCSLMFLDFAQ